MQNSTVLKDLQATIARLNSRIDELEHRLEASERENRRLRERLARYENPKNSRNSSVPPSRDENRPKKNQSLRRPTGKKPGGQPGHGGSTLEMSPDPDRTIDLVPDFCNTCGTSLSGRPAIWKGARQVVDIPPIRAEVTEYRSHSRVCACGCTTTSGFPDGVGAPVGYGPNIEALTGYFHARQYLPFKRMQEMYNDVFNVGISEGGLHCLLDRFAGRAVPIYEEIRRRVATAMVVGTDETGARVNGGKHWFWTWQTPGLTFIAHSPTRGSAAIEANFPGGFPGATLVHDGWRPQVGTTAANHQTCLAHLLRRLNYLREKYPGSAWPAEFKKLLCDAMEVGRKDGQAAQRYGVVRRLDELLGRPPDRAMEELHTFYERMCRERQHLFPFLFLRDVPPDNNASERAIRNVKVKQKISGQFKTEKAARNFAVLRSVVDTVIKNGTNILGALILIAKLQPQFRD